MTSNKMETCTKCDETGHIVTKVNGGISGRSCDCGKYQKLMEERWKDVDIMDLLAYGYMRVAQKKQQNGK